MIIFYSNIMKEHEAMIVYLQDRLFTQEKGLQDANLRMRNNNPPLYFAMLLNMNIDDAMSKLKEMPEFKEMIFEKGSDILIFRKQLRMRPLIAVKLNYICYETVHELK